jgi:hypothetical protein
VPSRARVDCRTAKRSGKPATIQGLARLLVDEPDHHGVAKVLRRIAELKETDPKFAAIEMDCRKEFWAAVRLGDFETPDAGLAEITNRRTNPHALQRQNLRGQAGRPVLSLRRA